MDNRITHSQGMYGHLGNVKGGELICKIWVLQMTLRRRLGVTGVFLLAIALAHDHFPIMRSMLTLYRGLAASIARMVTWVQLEAGIYMTLLIKGLDATDTHHSRP